ncbi:MAG: hypothetical protein K2Q26_15850 [Bdellovibrionales bacterium]|nr:hypothetical protein [Bdellovibrionales bacterium]
MQFCEEKRLHIARIKHFPDLYIKANTNPQENEDYKVYCLESLERPVGFGEIVYKNEKPFIKLHLGLTENYYVSLTDDLPPKKRT